MMLRRMVALSTALLLACRPAPAAPAAESIQRTAPAGESAAGAGVTVTGKLVYVANREVQVLDLSSMERTTVTATAPRGTVTHVAGSPDGQRIAYSAIALGQGYDVSGNEVVVANIDGSQPRVVARPESSGLFLSWPAWLADRDSLVLAVSGTQGSEVVERLERLDLDSGARALLAEPGHSPTASSDGQLAFVRNVGKRWNVWLRSSAGELKRLVAEDWFDDVDMPRFSPDGKSLAFAVVGNGPRLSALDAVPTIIFQLVSMPIAYAHQEQPDPYDLWQIAADGAGLKRVAKIQQRQASIAWSPDGRRIAVRGDLGLQIVEAETGKAARLNDEVGYGPFDWVP